MSDSGGPIVDAAVVRSAAQLCRVTLPPERLEAVAETLDGLLRESDRLFELELGETLPASTFDPRRRG